jgi:phytoene dehydrogenase-like protein
MPLAMRLLPMALRDIVEENVGDARLSAGIGSRATVASTYGPYQPGLGLPLLYHRPAWTDGLFRQPTFVAGGMGALAEALAAAARKAGAEIRTEARVERIGVDDAGITGVVLEDGTEVGARRVLSTVDPRTTMLDLLEPGWLETDMLFAARTLRAHGTVSIVRLALDGLPAFRDVDAGALSGTVEIAPTMKYQEQAADNVKYGRVPEHPTIEITLPSITDPSLAPAGKHVLHAWVQYTPYRLRDTTWDGERDRLGKIVLDTIERYAPGLSSLVTAVDVATPLDIERRYGAMDGHVYHAAQTLDQSLYMRPFAGRYDYRMPVNGLYLGGSGCHPGGGITGLPGKLAAQRVLEDWKARRAA